MLSNKLALSVQASWAGLAGRLLQAGPAFRTVVPHGASCEDMKDTRSLPSYSVWGKPVAAGGRGGGHGAGGGGRRSWAVTAINSVASAQPIRVELAALGLTGAVTATDVWTGKKTDVAGGAWQCTLAAGAHQFVLLEES